MARISHGQNDGRAVLRAFSIVVSKYSSRSRSNFSCVARKLAMRAAISSRAPLSCSWLTRSWLMRSWLMRFWPKLCWLRWSSCSVMPILFCWSLVGVALDPVVLIGCPINVKSQRKYIRTPIGARIEKQLREICNRQASLHDRLCGRAYWWISVACSCPKHVFGSRKTRRWRDDIHPTVL
jgi:hypothetical protein